jgi:hypothetical protein
MVKKSIDIDQEAIDLSSTKYKMKIYPFKREVDYPLQFVDVLISFEHHTSIMRCLLK